MDIVQQKFSFLCSYPSDINEHLATLSRYASECESVLETGVRGCVSSWALAHGLLMNSDGKGRKILLNDISPCPVHEFVEIMKQLDIEVALEWKNNLEMVFAKDEMYDLTFIDTWHVYAQLKRELELFSSVTRKYIIMHDTTVDEWDGETVRILRDYGLISADWDPDIQSQRTGFPVEDIKKGLWPAITEFLDVHPEWELHERFTHNNGLTILRRKPQPQ
jgi:hypothetical protein